MTYTYDIASPDELRRIWEKDVAAHPGEPEWSRWRTEYIAYNQAGMAVTFVVCADGDPVGQGTLLLSTACSALKNRPAVCDGRTYGNINALRIEKAHEGKGHISAMIPQMEAYAKKSGSMRLPSAWKPPRRAISPSTCTGDMTSSYSPRRRMTR